MGGIDLWHVFIVLIAVGIYLLPTLIAFRRDHPKRMPILGLNVLLGWTILGWWAALIWAIIPAKPISP